MNTSGRIFVLLAAAAAVAVLAYVWRLNGQPIQAPRDPSPNASNSEVPFVEAVQPQHAVEAVLTDVLVHETWPARSEPAAEEAGDERNAERVHLPIQATRDDEKKADGWHTQHHPNGLIAWEGEYERGSRTGLWREYAETGVCLLEGVYDRGEATGVWRCWYENGNPQGVASCDRGQFHGDCRFWTPSGAPDPVRSGRYMKGERTE